MVQQVVLTGMVLSSMPIGEYDKRIVILTDERGKITAFSRGSRRPNSTMLGATEPCVFGKFILIEGRNSYTLVGAEISRYFMELRNDITGAFLGFYCLELAGYFTKENMECREVLNLLVATFNAVCKKKVPARLIRRIFELKMLVIYGTYPQMFECVKCGRTGQLEYFSEKLSGMVCPLCKKFAGNTLPVMPSSLYAMQYIISSEIEKLYSFTVKEDVLTQMEPVIDRCLKSVAGIKFKSEEMLEMML